MPGYRYELLYRDGALIRRADYWSAFRLQRGSKVVLGHELLVVEETHPSTHADADFVAHCRRAREDERFG